MINQGQLRRIYLIGLPGSGKTSVAPLLAAQLGWDWLDLDSFIEAQAGETIPAIFARGEAEFRRRESAALANVSQRAPLVVATGGGVVLAAENRQRMRETGVVVALAVAPDIASERLTTHDVERPLLRGDRVVRLQTLATERAALYHDAHLVIPTGAVAQEAVAQRVIAGLAALGLLPLATAPALEIPVAFAHGAHTITVGYGALARLPAIITDLHLPRRLTVISDEHIAELLLPGVVQLLAQADVVVRTIVVPAGEGSKSLTQLSAIYDELIAAHHERSEAIVALGGGVVGDLAGFVAATYQRGVPVIQVPTTLLAMVDSAIGGKTGINHPRAKNIIGAFYQPWAILSDPAVLLTLPDRIYHEGWGEIVKYGMALDGELFAQLEREGENLLNRQASSLLPIIARCAQIKAEIVAGDEREAGRRIVLNYGHTLGHALEATAGYGTLLHGEAVFLGMALEARIAFQMGLIAADVVARQDALSRIFYTPTSLAAMPPADVLAATRLDKKTQGGRVRWVLPTGIGRTTIRDDVPDELVLDVLRTWQA